MNRYLENLDEVENHLLPFLKNGKKNIIFGAGSFALTMLRIFKSINIEVECLVVNDGYRNEEQKSGVKIYEVSELKYDDDEVNIFVAVYLNDESILTDIRKKYDKSLVIADFAKDLGYLEMLYYKEYFKKNGIDMDSAVLDIKGIKLLNPFFRESDYRTAFLLEINDLILPEIMNDYSRIDEGNYEYGKVKLEKNDVVIDCGANIGIFSAVASYKGCKPYAFEPFPKSQEYIKELSALYNNEIEVCGYALSSQCGTTKFNVQNENLVGNSIENERLKEGDYTIEVKVTTIDEFVKSNSIEKVDFIKADIEGSERYMLMGAKETLKNMAPKLAICTYHYPDDPQVLEKIIKDANPNYVIEHKWKKLYAYVPDKN
ncbi:MAG: FkbM family methyltransferase [Clostridiaceae bacterium]|nr:FkbM family methyltransferase [Clostridiaceae bacterium]